MDTFPRYQRQRDDEARRLRSLEWAVSKLLWDERNAPILRTPLMPQSDALLRLLAADALKALADRKGEDVHTWAKRLADDLAQLND